MEANKTFDKAYAAATISIFNQLDRILDLVIDYPLDSSTGADWAHLGELGHISASLSEVLQFMENK